MVLAGDFWQLDPPEQGGWSLSRLPSDLCGIATRSKPAATAEYGLSLMWSSNASEGLHGVTELQRPERCKDVWYNEVLDECRQGDMSQDSCNFLHGLPTTVPGSWTRSGASCLKAGCQRLAGKPWDVIRGEECVVCQTERSSKQLVATGPDDPRFASDIFTSAPLIVPNNDIKFHTNKTRAQEFAVKTAQQIVWAQAKDVPSAEVLKATPCDASAKLKWLNRHDRESGDLYGMLPLVRDMPVVLTDHLDRNPEENLLRGSRGRLHSWKLHDDEASVYHENHRVLQHLPDVLRQVR